MAKRFLSDEFVEWFSQHYGQVQQRLDPMADECRRDESNIPDEIQRIVQQSDSPMEVGAIKRQVLELLADKYDAKEWVVFVNHSPLWDRPCDGYSPCAKHRAHHFPIQDGIHTVRNERGTSVVAVSMNQTGPDDDDDLLFRRVASRVVFYSGKAIDIVQLHAKMRLDMGPELARAVHLGIAMGSGKVALGATPGARYRLTQRGDWNYLLVPNGRPGPANLSSFVSGDKTVLRNGKTGMYLSATDQQVSLSADRSHLWQWVNGTIRHDLSGQCLTAQSYYQKLSLSSCIESSSNQQWARAGSQVAQKDSNGEFYCLQGTGKNLLSFDLCSTKLITGKLDRSEFWYDHDADDEVEPTQISSTESINLWNAHLDVFLSASNWYIAVNIAKSFETGHFRSYWFSPNEKPVDSCVVMAEQLWTGGAPEQSWNFQAGRLKNGLGKCLTVWKKTSWYLYSYDCSNGGSGQRWKWSEDASARQGNGRQIKNDWGYCLTAIERTSKAISTSGYERYYVVQDHCRPQDPAQRWSSIKNAPSFVLW